ncbi:hypothetical protein AYI68_g1505 [Smittium mucronatum]|uniref:Uncharacterized protein n=1 Tax=Smittium mucronatum TaxID=133383 RepID=A0A1R0H5E8_9FUNG|nr:hypothetical protein AYI68_g1505 [Smittium mucronatum]
MEEPNNEFRKTLQPKSLIEPVLQSFDETSLHSQDTFPENQLPSNVSNQDSFSKNMSSLKDKNAVFLGFDNISDSSDSDSDVEIFQSRKNATSIEFSGMVKTTTVGFSDSIIPKNSAIDSNGDKIANSLRISKTYGKMSENFVQNEIIPILNPENSTSLFNKNEILLNPHNNFPEPISQNIINEINIPENIDHTSKDPGFQNSSSKRKLSDADFNVSNDINNSESFYYKKPSYNPYDQDFPDFPPLEHLIEDEINSRLPYMNQEKYFPDDDIFDEFSSHTSDAPQNNISIPSSSISSKGVYNNKFTGFEVLDKNDDTSNIMLKKLDKSQKNNAYKEPYNKGGPTDGRLYAGQQWAHEDADPNAVPFGGSSKSYGKFGGQSRNNFNKNKFVLEEEKQNLGFVDPTDSYFALMEARKSSLLNPLNSQNLYDPQTLRNLEKARLRIKDSDDKKSFSKSIPSFESKHKSVKCISDDYSKPPMNGSYVSALSFDGKPLYFKKKSQNELKEGEKVNTMLITIYQSWSYLYYMYIYFMYLMYRLPKLPLKKIYRKSL